MSFPHCEVKMVLNLPSLMKTVLMILVMLKVRKWERCEQKRSRSAFLWDLLSYSPGAFILNVSPLMKE